MGSNDIDLAFFFFFSWDVTEEAETEDVGELEALDVDFSSPVCGGKILTSIQASNKFNYRNDPKFLDRQVWANSADPDQTAPIGGAV